MILKEKKKKEKIFSELFKIQSRNSPDAPFSDRRTDNTPRTEFLRQGAGVIKHYEFVICNFRKIARLHSKLVFINDSQSLWFCLDKHTSLLQSPYIMRP